MIFFFHQNYAPFSTWTFQNSRSLAAYRKMKGLVFKRVEKIVNKVLAAGIFSLPYNISKSILPYSCSDSGLLSKYLQL